MKSLVVAAVASRESARGGRAARVRARARAPARAGALRRLPLAAEPARHAANEAGAGPDVFLDLVLSRLELLADGDAAKALRVRLRFPYAPAERGATALFLVRERGGLRLLATDPACRSSAAEALRLAEAGDLAGARRWVGWAREALPGAEGDPGSPAGVLAALSPPARRATRRAAPRGAPRSSRGPTAAAHGAPSSPRRSRRRAIPPSGARSVSPCCARSAERQAQEMLAHGAGALLAEEPASREAFVAAAWALAAAPAGADLDRAADALLAPPPRGPGGARLARRRRGCCSVIARRRARPAPAHRGRPRHPRRLQRRGVAGAVPRRRSARGAPTGRAAPSTARRAITRR